MLSNKVLQSIRGTENTMDYSIFHVEKYRHGKIEKNDLDGSKKVTIADHVGYYDVYECESTKKRKRC